MSSHSEIHAEMVACDCCEILMMPADAKPCFGCSEVLFCEPCDGQGVVCQSCLHVEWEPHVAEVQTETESSRDPENGSARI